MSSLVGYWEQSNYMFVTRGQEESKTVFPVLRNYEIWLTVEDIRGFAFGLKRIKSISVCQ